MALTSDQINVLRDSAYAIAQPITEFILKDVARRVAKAGKITDILKMKRIICLQLNAMPSEN